MYQPIVVIYLPPNYSWSESGYILNPLELTRELNGWSDKVVPKEHLGGYLWFCFSKEGITEPEFKTFYKKDFTKIQLEELKKLVTDSLCSQ